MPGIRITLEIDSEVIEKCLEISRNSQMAAAGIPAPVDSTTTQDLENVMGEFSRLFAQMSVPPKKDDE